MTMASQSLFQFFWQDRQACSLPDPVKLDYKFELYNGKVLQPLPNNLESLMSLI